jgi:flagellin
MASSINTNVASMNAQRNLSRSQGDLNTAIQRLSSGLRINSAKDDAAGSAIANRMTTQIGGLTVAIRNANDGISVAQTAEGAMEEMANNMNRARDLAVQAASYNNSTDRATINKEVSQILDEMSRIVNQTRYNGEKVLTGSFSGDFQVGAQVNETINVAVGNLSPTSLGVASEYSTVSGLSSANLASRVAFSYNNAIATANTIEGTNFTTARASGTTTSTKVADINSLTSSTGVSAFSFGNGLVGTNYASAGTSAGVTDGIAAGSLSINGVAIGAVASAASDGAVASGGRRSCTYRNVLPRTIRRAPGGGDAQDRAEGGDGEHECGDDQDARWTVGLRIRGGAVDRLLGGVAGHLVSSMSGSRS